MLGTAMSCQPGVVGDPEKRTDPGLRRHQLSGERRIPSVVPRPGAVSSPCTATMSRPQRASEHFEPGEVRNAQRVSLNSPGREPASLGALVDEETLGTDGARYVICITALRSHTRMAQSQRLPGRHIHAVAGPCRSIDCATGFQAGAIAINGGVKTIHYCFIQVADGL